MSAIYQVEHPHSSLALIPLEFGSLAVRIGIALVALDATEVAELHDALGDWLAQQKGGES